MMKKYDPDGDGKIDGETFKDTVKAKADDLSNRIEDKLGSAAEAMKQWDKDGDGKLSKEEFMKGAKDMGISPGAAEAMWKEKGGDEGGMDMDKFARAFGIGPDEILERCFLHFGNPKQAFEEMDKDHDGLLHPDEWKWGAKKMKLKPEQWERVWKDIDSNHK